MSRFEDSHDPPLQRALAGLAAVRFGDQTLVETLTQVAVLSVEAVRGADGTGVTVMEPARAPLCVASTDFVAAVDDMQYGLAEGPCIQATETGLTQVCGSLGGDDRWPPVRAAGSPPGGAQRPVPALGRGRIEDGFTEHHGHGRDAFTPEAIAIEEQFSALAAVTVANAVVLERSRRLTRQLESAPNSRAVIDQAIGMLMARNGGTAQEAFEHLKTISQAEGTKLVEVSRSLVAQAVARARARRTAP